MFFLALACCLAFVASASAQLTIIKSSATPSQVDSNDTGSVEVGVKFRSDISGYVTGVRFYKASTNKGTHIGHIWSRSGVLLGSATFTSETASGWQQVNFATPIAVSANTTYIASYFAPQGHYSTDDTFFASKGIDSPPLHALAYGVDGPNGVYRYGTTSGFPSSYYLSSNYWVDIVFTPQTTTAAPKLTVSTSTLAFGNVAINTAATQSLTLTSSGTSAVTISSAPVTGAGFTLVGSTFPLTLNPGQSATLQVQFKPTASGSVAGQLTINSNSSTGSTSAVSLSGTGTIAAAKPQLTMSASSLAFGSVTVNTAATKSVTLMSSGAMPLTINAASIAGTGFTIASGTFPVTLNPNQSVTVQVQFKPTASGSVAGQLSISSNSSTGSTSVVSLSGAGTAASNPQLSVSSTTLAFGSVTLNSATAKTVTLTSTGTSAVTVNSASITGAGFSILAGTFPVTLNPSQSVTLQLQFKPTTAGAVAGQLTISSNSTTGSTAAVALSGTGVAGTPQLAVSATTLSFGSVAVNTPTTQTVTLSSTGTSPVTINSATITGAGFSTVGGSFPLTLNPSQTTTLKVQFDPTTAGAVTGKLTISSNSTTGGTAAVALSGTGTSTAHYVDLSWNPPASSTDPVAGYNLYRSPGGGSMTRLNAAPVTQTTYVDNGVLSGTTYNYYTKSVDAKGVESAASNQITVTIP